jgi:hypothetical protein
MTDFILTILGVAAIVFIYLLPSIICTRSPSQQRNGVLLVNLFLGWTGVFWFIALVWGSCLPKRTA